MGLPAPRHPPPQGPALRSGRKRQATQRLPQMAANDGSSCRSRKRKVADARRREAEQRPPLWQSAGSAGRPFERRWNEGSHCGFTQRADHQRRRWIHQARHGDRRRHRANAAVGASVALGVRCADGGERLVALATISRGRRACHFGNRMLGRVRMMFHRHRRRRCGRHGRHRTALQREQGHYEYQQVMEQYAHRRKS